MIVDNACMQLVMRPETFDVLLLPNLTARSGDHHAAPDQAAAATAE